MDLVDAGRPNWLTDGGRPVRVHVWRPRPRRGPIATVLISHGTGGAARQMCWLADPLARAGFLAVAVDHHGNSLIDDYTPEGFVRWWERARDLSFVIDALSASEGLGAIGAAGFSLGGYTVGALLGARVSGDRFQALIREEIPGPPPPEYPNLPAELRDRLSPSDVPVWAAEAEADYADARVRAGFLICPALGEMLQSDSLATISMPVAVRWVEGDEIVSQAQSVEPYVRNVPRVNARSLGGRIGHYAFLADNRDFAQLQAEVAAEACAFFDEYLVPSR
jgi:predicted dienelactone hydrolase